MSRILSVYIEKNGKQEYVGKIVGDSSVDACFSYDDSYIEKNGKPISISLPLEEKEDSRNQTKVTIKKDDEISDPYVLKVYYKPTVLTVGKKVTGYTLNADEAFTFTIKAQPPTGTDTSESIIKDGQIYIKKEGNIEKLTFTNNIATFTLKDKESVDISCLPMGWTYTIKEADPGGNYKTSYQKSGEPVGDGRSLLFKMEQESEKVTFFNTSQVAPPVTGKTVQNNSFILLLVLVFGVGIVSFGFFKRMKRKH